MLYDKYIEILESSGTKHKVPVTVIREYDIDGFPVIDVKTESGHVYTMGKDYVLSGSCSDTRHDP